MSDGRHYYRIGKALHDLYLHSEVDGREIVLRPNRDGKLTTPEGLAEVLDRLLLGRVLVATGPHDTMSLHALPEHSYGDEEDEEEDAEGTSGGQEGP